MAALGLAGCSWAMVKRAPKRANPPTRVECTSDRSAPHLDFGVVGALAVAFVVAQTQDCPADAEICITPGEIATVVVPLPFLLYLISGFTGISWTDECRAAKRRYADYLVKTDPGAGAAGHLCRMTLPACDPGLTCIADRCAAFTPGAAGQPCTPVPDWKDAYSCAPRLECQDDGICRAPR